MLAVSTVLPDTMPDHPPLILIRGSANSAAVWGSGSRHSRSRDGHRMPLICVVTGRVGHGISPTPVCRTMPPTSLYSLPSADSHRFSSAGGSPSIHDTHLVWVYTAQHGRAAEDAQIW